MADHPLRRETDIPRIQRVIAVFWPSFLTAGVATILFFTTFNPEEISVCIGYPKSVSNLGAYTVGFFLFWILTSSTCAFTCYFQRPCHKPAGKPGAGNDAP